MNLVTLLQMAAETFADRIAVGSAEAGISYQELFERARRGAALLAAREAERLTYLAPNRASFPVALFAASWAGIPLVPLNYRLGRVQIEPILAAQPNASVAIVDPTAPTDVGRSIESLMAVSDWDQLTASQSSMDVTPWEDDPRALALILYTSGTTSTPKAALLRHEHLASYVLGSVEFASGGDDAAALVSVPPYHIAGVSNVLSNVFAGRRIVYLDHFDPLDWLATIRRERVTHALVVPTMLARIVEALHGQGVEAANVPQLRTLAYGGARMPPSVIMRALELFPEVDFVNAYGLTETSSTIALLGPEDHRRALGSPESAVRQRLSSAGRVLPGIQVQIRDEAGSPLTEGGVGEIFVRAPQVSGEYESEGAVTDESGWFNTKDRGWIDRDGYLFIEGRADDTIIRGGENIAPAEIEDMLMRYPGVEDAVAVGVPDEEWGQRIVGVVTAAAGSDIDVEELRAFCREGLRGSKTPDLLHIWDELPRTPTGKVVRREVVARLTGPEGPAGPSGG